jgi:hypothetical protein
MSVRFINRWWKDACIPQLLVLDEWEEAKGAVACPLHQDRIGCAADFRLDKRRSLPHAAHGESGGF